MPTSSKPRKKYRPPAQRVTANQNKAFRYNAEAEMWLSMMPHTALEALRTGTATTDDYNTLAVRVFWGARMERDHFQSDEHRPFLERGVAAIAAISERAARLGQFGASGAELADRGDALTMTDQMQKLATRREQAQSLEAVLGSTAFKAAEKAQK